MTFALLHGCSIVFLIVFSIPFVRCLVALDDWHCSRASSLYEGIICPEGHYKVPKDQFDNRLCDLSETLGIQDLLTTQLRRLSLGERMKMELVAALLHQPQFLFLDEPTIGLDLISQQAIRKFLLEYP